MAFATRLTRSTGASPQLEPPSATSKLYCGCRGSDARADTTPLPLFPLIAKGLTPRGFTFREIAIDPERLTRAKSFITKGLADGALRPVIDRVFEFDDLVAAHRYLESNVQFGKIVVNV